MTRKEDKDLLLQSDCVNCRFYDGFGQCLEFGDKLVENCEMYDEEQYDENWGIAFATDLMKERMVNAREYGKMCERDDNIPAHVHAIDFENGAIWGFDQAKQAIVQWIIDNVENYTDYVDINKLEDTVL